METILIWLSSFLLAGIIISPFFWLKFLKQKSVWAYLIVSSVITILFLFAYIYPIDNFLSNWTAGANADLYYFYDDFSLNPILIVVVLISISPFIFTKILKYKFSLKIFLLDFFLAITIFAAIFLYWAFVLLPKAFGDLHNHF